MIYDWPGKYTPFAAQRQTTKFLASNRRAFCFNDLGSGKTMSALWAADFLRRHNRIGKVLILTPLSTMWSVWADEIYKNFVGRTFAVVHGTRRKRLKELAKNVDFYIINHDGMKTFYKFNEQGKIIHDGFAKRTDITHVILDEAGEFRNANTKRYKAMRCLAGPDSKRSLWAMTGSPMPKAPTDAWALARLVDPSRGVDPFYTHFRNKVMYKVGETVWEPRSEWEAYCYSILQPSIRFRLEDCVDLPPMMMERRSVEMSKAQATVYKQLKDKYVAEFKEGKIVALNEGAKLNKLLQVASGAIFDNEHNPHFIDCKPKLQMLAETLEQVGNKVIIFGPFRPTVALLYSFLTKYLKIPKVALIQNESGKGNISATARATVFRDFQEGDTNILLAHPGSMAHGLTLTSSAVIIFFSPVDDYRIHEQAIGRIRRPSQTRTQVIIELSCSEVEKRIYARLEKKQSMQGLLLEMLAKRGNN